MKDILRQAYDAGIRRKAFDNALIDDSVTWLAPKPPEFEQWYNKLAQDGGLSSVSPRVLFDAALELLRDLADIQNGAPLVTVEKEWEEIMKKTYDFLEANEG